MRIVITRAFEKTKQVAQYEPIKSFCSAEVSFEADGLPDLDEMQIHSAALDSFVRSEVLKTIADELKQREMDAKAACAACGGKQLYGGSGLNADGLCKTCEASVAATRREFKKGDKRATVDFG